MYFLIEKVTDINIKCVIVDQESDTLSLVKHLYEQNKKTLGFLPNGAFEDYAQKKSIIAAISDSDSLLGYIAFRKTKRRAVVAHLCINVQLRGPGPSPIIANALFDQFLRVTRDRKNEMEGALVSCRTDYRLDSMWKHLGFTLNGTRPARKSGKTLQLWWYDFDRPNLFSLVQTPELAVLDTCIFLDMLNPNEKFHDEAQSLSQPWLAEKFQLGVTPELSEEIKRSNDRRDQGKKLAEASEFELCTGQGIDTVLKQVTEIFGIPKTNNQKSDHLQLAHTKAGRAAYFLTRDETLLKQRLELNEKLSIEVMSPAELRRKYDEDERPSAYEPAQLDGSNIEFRQMKSSELHSCINKFLADTQREKKSVFKQTLKSAMLDSLHSSIEIVIDEDAEIIGLTVVRKTPGQKWKIQAVRVAPVSLSTTLLWHLVWRQVTEAVNQGALAVQLSDEYAPRGIEAALAEMGFVEEEGCWQKIILRSKVMLENIPTKLRELSDIGLRTESSSNETSQLVRSSPNQREAAMHRLEKLVWPAQIGNGDISSFVVAIRPEWAQKLFDSKGAEEKIFSEKAELILKFENVYYRDGQQETPVPMSRVLWYVSVAKPERRSKEIRAVSLVNEVEKDTPSRLFKKYQKYGVFTFQNLQQMQRKPNAKLIAFTFSHTFLLPKPISHRDAIGLLDERSIPHNNFQSPLKLDEKDWIELYLMGLKEDES